jgi:hypothetical protein
MKLTDVTLKQYPTIWVILSFYDTIGILQGNIICYWSTRGSYHSEIIATNLNKIVNTLQQYYTTYLTQKKNEI